MQAPPPRIPTCTQCAMDSVSLPIGSTREHTVKVSGLKSKDTCTVGTGTDHTCTCLRDATVAPKLHRHTCTARACAPVNSSVPAFAVARPPSGPCRSTPNAKTHKYGNSRGLAPGCPLAAQQLPATEPHDMTTGPPASSPRGMRRCCCPLLRLFRILRTTTYGTPTWRLAPAPLTPPYWALPCVHWTSTTSTLRTSLPPCPRPRCTSLPYHFPAARSSAARFSPSLKAWKPFSVSRSRPPSSGTSRPLKSSPAPRKKRRERNGRHKVSTGIRTGVEPWCVAYWKEREA